MLDDVRIMLVEDEALLALDLSTTLEDQGAVVTGPFASVRTALPCCDGVDAAVLDVDLRGSKVFPVADLLRAHGVPFVFHTGRSDLSILQSRYGEEVPILVKPARGEEIVDALRQVIPTCASVAHQHI